MPSIPWDTIGYWTEIKLDIIRKYAVAYATIMAQQRNIRRFGYIDAFCGPGVHVSKQTGEFVHGSPLNALLIQPQFSAYHFIDIDGDKASALRKLAGAHERVQVQQAAVRERDVRLHAARHDRRGDLGVVVVLDHEAARRRVRRGEAGERVPERQVSVAGERR